MPKSECPYTRLSVVIGDALRLDEERLLRNAPKTAWNEGISMCHWRYAQFWLSH
jgi:hypothetical protein